MAGGSVYSRPAPSNVGRILASTQKRESDMASEMPEAGTDAPDFTGKTQDGEEIRLRDFRGRMVVLYFYPKDDTSGCTKQACNLRDNYQALLDAGIAVIGVSGDDVESHSEFARKYDLPFPLIADTEHDVLNKYGVWGDRTLYGRIFKGTTRTTFVIDEDGTIRHVFKRPKVGEHAEEIMRVIGP
jgi:thioredoxin-dependent peroxiredoxin